MNIFPSVPINISHTLAKKISIEESEESDLNDILSSTSDIYMEEPIENKEDTENTENTENKNNICDINTVSAPHKIDGDHDHDHDHDNINSNSILNILEQNEHSSTTLIKKNKNGLYSLNTYDEVFFKKYKERLVRKKEIYVVSSELFQKKSLFLTIPCILITCIMSIISFLSASTYFTENTRLILSLVVGTLGSLGTLCQSFQSTLNYKTKAEAFRNAAEKYDNLITKIKFELYNHNENDFIDNLEKEVLKISSTCKYFPPQSVKNLIIFNDKYVNKISHLLEKDIQPKKESTTIRDINNMRITIGT